MKRNFVRIALPVACIALLLAILLEPSAAQDVTRGSPIPKYSGAPKTHDFSFNVIRETAAPDGVSRPMIRVNSQFPGPKIEVFKGDTILVNVRNQLNSSGTTIHWHGLHQKGTPWYDGPAGVTQCPIPAGHSLEYAFSTADQSGTFWWHGHHDAQIADGLLGALIIHDPDDPNRHGYDEEMTVMIQDYLHTESPEVIKKQQLEVNLDNILINGKNVFINGGKRAEFIFEPKKRYRIRVINSGLQFGLIFSIDDHPMQIIEVDGQAVKPYSVNRLPIQVGQRYSVIVEANGDPQRSYWMRADVQLPCFRVTPTIISAQAIVHYNDSQEAPTSTPYVDYVPPCIEFEGLGSLVPLGTPPLPPFSGRQLSFLITFDVARNMMVFNGGAWIADLDNPTLESAINLPPGVDPTHAFGPDQNIYPIYDKGPWRILIQNNGTVGHPFHFHGHNFYVLGTGVGNFTTTPGPLNTRNPVQRDVLQVPAKGWGLIQFNADNPGAWMFHCHFQWHMIRGMSVTILELPPAIRKLNQPSDVSNLCNPHAITAETAKTTAAAAATRTAADKLLSFALCPIYLFFFFAYLRPF